MKTIPCKLKDALVFEPRVFHDLRGRFLELWNQRTFEHNGLAQGFVQDNVSYSDRHVLRGLHYQIRQPQGKLVTVLAGEVFDVIVDLRRDSPTFGQSEGIQLDSKSQRMLWVPPGFAHGFLTLSAEAVFHYKCTDFYAPEYERTLHWNDPQLEIRWPYIDDTAPVVSAKDAEGRAFADCEYF